MNERIKELANQAWNDTDITQDIVYKMSFTERFAELIVRECLSNMKNCDGDLDFAIWKIKNDFGIE